LGPPEGDAPTYAEIGIKKKHAARAIAKNFGGFKDLSAGEW
jgi:hypothetical protein